MGKITSTRASTPLPSTYAHLRGQNVERIEATPIKPKYKDEVVKVIAFSDPATGVAGIGIVSVHSATRVGTEATTCDLLRKKCDLENEDKKNIWKSFALYFGSAYILSSALIGVSNLLAGAPIIDPISISTSVLGCSFVSGVMTKVGLLFPTYRIRREKIRKEIGAIDAELASMERAAEESKGTAPAALEAEPSLFRQ